MLKTSWTAISSATSYTTKIQIQQQNVRTLSRLLHRKLNSSFIFTSTDIDRVDGDGNGKSQIILFAENYGYGIVPESDSIIYENFESSKSTEKSMKTKYVIQSRDLMAFSKQIACGMVGCCNCYNFIKK